MLQRPALLHHVRAALERSRVVALIGPRQCGKTTLARELVGVDSPHYFDLEDPVSLARLSEPMTALRDLRELVVIDEVQRRPERDRIDPPQPVAQGIVRGNPVGQVQKASRPSPPPRSGPRTGPSSEYRTVGAVYSATRGADQAGRQNTGAGGGLEAWVLHCHTVFLWADFYGFQRASRE